MSQEQTISAATAGTMTIGGDLTVNRMGYGAMRITGTGVWGPPADIPAALATLRRTVELDVDLIDTADSYGPETSEELIAEALYPYPACKRQSPELCAKRSHPMRLECVLLARRGAQGTGERRLRCRPQNRSSALENFFRSPMS